MDMSRYVISICNLLCFGIMLAEGCFNVVLFVIIALLCQFHMHASDVSLGDLVASY